MNSRSFGLEILKSDTGLAAWLVSFSKTPASGLPTKARTFLAAFMLLLICELPATLPGNAQSQAGSSASSQAGLQAPVNLGRRRRGRRGLYRRQMNQANRLAAQQQMQRARELSRQQQKGDQTQLKREQALARAKHSDFIKEYGSGKGRRLRHKPRSGAISTHSSANTPASASSKPNSK